MIRILDPGESVKFARFWALLAMTLGLIGVLVVASGRHDPAQALRWMLLLVPVVGGVQAFLTWGAVSSTVVAVEFAGETVSFVRLRGSLHVWAGDLLEATWVGEGARPATRRYWQIRARTGSVRLIDNNASARVVTELHELNPRMRITQRG